MKCARCKAVLESGRRFCGYCAAKADEPRLAWDDPKLAVASDPPLRRKYRLLQSWYRENVLNVDYGFSYLKKPRPVGSLLAPETVASDPTLNFLHDESILRYVNQRIPDVQAASGTLEEHRLRHNMLSSMPMAFSLVAAIRQAHDRDEIVSSLFGVDCKEVIEIFAEWTPDRPQAELLNDRTAFDAAVLYRSASGDTRLIGIETKYTEPLSQKPYLKDRYVQVTERCGWFKPGADSALVGSSTNQLWRNALLAAVSMDSVVDDAHLAIIGLDEDTSLWDSTDSVAAQMTQPDRLLRRPWNRVVEVARETSLASFTERFNERYLDTRPLTDPQTPIRLHHPARSKEVENRWTFVAVKTRPRPTKTTAGEDGDWTTWIPTIWSVSGHEMLPIGGR